MSVVNDVAPTLGPSAYNRIYSSILAEFEKSDLRECTLREENYRLRGLPEEERKDAR